jgi:hypothetical protein
MRREGNRPAVVGVALALAAVAAGCPKREPAGDKPAGLPAAPSASPTPTAAPAAPAAPAPPAAPGTTAVVAKGVGEAEVVPSPPDPAHTIAGTIRLPAARKKDVKPGDTIFLIARRAGGPPGPGSMLAVQRLTAGDFPMPFTLSGRDAMVPGTPFEGLVSLTVRVDKDGDAITRRKGDVYGQANGVKVGTQNVPLSLDTLQAEDVTLGGAMPGGNPHGGLPPGHP